MTANTITYFSHHHDDPDAVVAVPTNDFKEVTCGLRAVVGAGKAKGGAATAGAGPAVDIMYT